MYRVLGLLLLCSAAVAELEPNFFLIRYYPGENWNRSISYAEQPGLRAHHAYVEDLYKRDQMVMSGEVDGESVGLAMVKVPNLEDVEAIVRTDPGVATKILRAEIIGWDIRYSSMRFVKPRPVEAIEDPDKPFRLRRRDQDSAINTDNSESKPRPEPY